MSLQVKYNLKSRFNLTCRDPVDSNKTIRPRKFGTKS